MLRFGKFKGHANENINNDKKIKIKKYIYSVYKKPCGHM